MKKPGQGLTPPTEATLAAALQAAENSLGEAKCDALAIAVVVVRTGESGAPESHCVIVPEHILPAGSVAACLFLAARNAAAGQGIHFPDPVPMGQANPLHTHRPSGHGGATNLQHGRGKTRVN